jgi:hypothetical protein
MRSGEAWRHRSNAIHVVQPPACTCWWQSARADEYLRASSPTVPGLRQHAPERRHPREVRRVNIERLIAVDGLIVRRAYAARGRADRSGAERPNRSLGRPRRTVSRLPRA